MSANFAPDPCQSNDDEILQLVHGLYETGKPSLEWVVRHSQHADPANVAWWHSVRSDAMVDLVSILVEAKLMPEHALGHAIVAQNTTARMFHLGFRRVGSSYEATAAAMVRAVVPKIPSLEAIVIAVALMRAREPNRG